MLQRLQQEVMGLSKREKQRENLDNKGRSGREAFRGGRPEEDGIILGCDRTMEEERWKGGWETSDAWSEPDRSVSLQRLGLPRHLLFVASREESTTEVEEPWEDDSDDDEEEEEWKKCKVS